MSAPTFEELLNPKSFATLTDELKEMIRARATADPDAWGLNSWFDGSTGRTLQEIEAFVVADWETALVKIVGSGFLETSEGGWLTKLASNFFGVERAQSVALLGFVRLTAQPGIGPYTVPENGITASAQVGLNQLRYKNTGSAIIPSGGSVDIPIQAEFAGSSFNLPVGAINKLLVAIPGVSVTNPSGWVIRAGVDEESDTRLRERCRLRFALRAVNAPADTYKGWVFEASATITKVKVLSVPRTQGSVDVICWGDGPPGSSIVTDDNLVPAPYPSNYTPGTVNAYVQLRRPIGADVRVYQATELVVPLVGVIQVKTGYGVLAKSQGLERITTLQKALDIGGEDGNVFKSSISEALFVRAQNVTNVNLSSPAADLSIAPNQAVTFDVTGLTWQDV
jgi:uncharacterized phage protein gp47/JayE